MGGEGTTVEKVHLIVDLSKCIGCYNCKLACIDEHMGNRWLPYTYEQEKHGEAWISPKRHERGKVPFTEVCYVTTTCQHCENAACQKRFPDAVTRREDGIVLLDAEKVRGNRAIVDSCPYGSIVWNEELQTAQKCTMCAHLLDSGWSEPRCVKACPLRALSFIRCTDEQFRRLCENQVLSPMSNGENEPRVVYKNLYRYNTCFIAGALASVENGVERACAGARVGLSMNSCKLGEFETDFLGEFKIDHIPAGSGEFELTFSLDGYIPMKQAVTVDTESICLDALVFEKQ